MKNQPRPPGVERRKKPRAPLEVAPPVEPKSSLKPFWIIVAVILAVAGLSALFAIFWMGVTGEL